MNALYSILYKSTDLLKPFIIIPLFLNTYGTKSYGLLSQIILFSMLIYPILDLGINYGSQRFFHNKTDNTKKILSNILFIELIVSVIMLIIIFYAFNNISYLYTLIFGYTNSIALTISVLIYTGLFAFTITYIGIYRGFGEFKKLVIIKIVIDILEVISLSVWILNTKVFDERYIFILILSKFILLIALILIVKIKPSFYDLKKNQSKIEEFFKYSLLLIPTALIGFINSSSDRFFISHFFGLKAVGLYSVAYQYIAYITLIVFPFTFGYFATLSKKFEEKKYLELKKILKNIYYFTFILTLCAVIVVFVMKNFIYETFLGIIIDNAFNKVIFYTLITVFFLNLISIQSMIFNIIKKNGLVLKMLIVTAFINIILNSIYMKNYGYHYAALSTVISTILFFGMQLFYLYKYKGKLNGK